MRRVTNVTHRIGTVDDVEEPQHRHRDANDWSIHQGNQRLREVNEALHEVTENALYIYIYIYIYICVRLFTKYHIVRVFAQMQSS